MKMTLRWYGEGHDTVSLAQIRQIAGVVGVITTLYDTKPGEIWPRERIAAMKAGVEASGLEVSGIESVNVHDDIKTAAPGRDQMIDNYIRTLTNLGEAGINLVCYNFMPVFDWTRSALAKPREDGATVLSYDQSIIDQFDAENMVASLGNQAQGFVLPGWEPERMAHIASLFDAYRQIDEEKLFAHLVYFLEAIGPVCEKYGIMMGIHPDDPAWPVFGLPRIVTGMEKIQRLMKAIDKPYNGVTLCTGSLGSNPQNDIPAIIRSLAGRVHFAHVRNLRHLAPGKFDEAAHWQQDGSLDIRAIMQALRDIGFDGPIRPDHGRMIWGESAMPGYGLYDRALGASYLLGLWDGMR